MADPVIRAGAQLYTHPDGAPGARLVTPEANMRYYEMTSEYRARDFEIGQGAQARVHAERETIVLPNGQTETLPASSVERRARGAGAKPVIRWGRRKRLTGKDYDPNRPLRTVAEIMGWE